MTVLRVDVARELALCADEAGEHRTVEIALVQPVARAMSCSSTPGRRSGA